MKIKLNWHDATKVQPEEGEIVEVVRPLSDWPQVVKGYKQQGEWYNMIGQKITVKKWRTLSLPQK